MASVCAELATSSGVFSKQPERSTYSVFFLILSNCETLVSYTFVRKCKLKGRKINKCIAQLSGKKSNSTHFAQSPLSTVFVPKVLFLEENVQKLYMAGYETRYISEKSSPKEIF